MFSSIDIVTKEEVVGFWWETAVLKKSKKIIILAVNVTCGFGKSTKERHERGVDSGRTADLDGGLELEKDRLGDEYFAGFCAEVFDFVLLKLYRLARSIPANCLGKKKSKS